MTTYAGDPSSYPTDFPLFSDATPPTASDLLVPIEALADRTAWLKAQTDALSAYALQPALNWAQQTVSAATAAAFSSTYSALYVPPTREWLAFGLTGCVIASFDHGATWSQSSVNAAAGTDNVVTGDFDTTGDVVLTTSTSPSNRYCFVRTAGAWSKVDVMGAAGSSVADNPEVAFAPIIGRWCWRFYDGTAHIYRTSTNKTAWSAITAAPTGTWPTNGMCRMRADKVSGRLVLVGANATTVAVATSDDGGVTWTTRASVTHGITSPAQVGLVRDYVTGTWYLNVVGTSSGTAIFKSTDGVTWSPVATFTARIFRFAVVGPSSLLVGAVPLTGTSMGVVYSQTNGASWLSAGRALSTGSPGSQWGLFEGGGGLLAPGTSLHASARQGGGIYAPGAVFAPSVVS